MIKNSKVWLILSLTVKFQKLLFSLLNTETHFVYKDFSYSKRIFKYFISIFYINIYKNNEFLINAANAKSDWMARSWLQLVKTMCLLTPGLQ